MLTINLVSLGGLSFGPTVTGVGHIGPGAPNPAAAADLVVPWHPPQQAPDLFALLGWHAKLSDFGGRDDELEALGAWAADDRPISVKFVIGEGGVGKSRLAAEFASLLQRDEWSAGFVDLRRPHDFQLKQAGSLLVVDYLEENRSAVGELLRDLAGLSSPDRLRVLFLTRRGFDDWQELIHDNNAAGIVNMSPVLVGRLEGPPAHAAFCSVQERAGEIFGSVPLPLSEEALATWLDHAPENQRALFVVAAALHSAMEPDEPVVRYTGREVVEGLVARELARLRRTAGGAGLSDRDALARLLAMAAIADRLEAETIRALVSDPALDLGLPHDGALHQVLGQSGLLSGRAIHAPKPDIVASCLVVGVLGAVPERAPEWLWAAAAPDLAGGIERFVRLSHDAEVVLGLRDPTKRLSEWMAVAIRGNVERSRAIDPILDMGNLTIGTAPLYVAALSTLHESAQDDGDKARYLSNFAVALWMLGDGAAALEAVREAVKIYRRLAAANPARFEPDLATSLNNLSNRLSDAGDGAAALEAIREAAEIYRRLAAANPARFELDLAMSLNNISTELSDAGDGAAPLEAIREAVEIRRRLAAANPARFEPDLTMSMGAYGTILRLQDRVAEAADAFREGIALARPHAERAPNGPHARLLENLERALEQTLA